ncbi:MAG: hypothetical protein IIB57_00380 [Planctomycetes bacterium]|nr:hypothetical protein [Planctomycetota bacterium]
MMKHFVIGLRMTGFLLWSVFVPSAAAQIGPDVVVKLEEFGHNNRVGPIGKGVIGAGMGTTSCNKGDEPVSWFQLPDTDHPFFPSNFYRLMTVAGSNRFEQIGQSWVKHGFGTEDLDLCGFGCTPPPLNGVQLGIGCTDTYSSGQAMVPCDLSPRSAFNPYTGVMLGGNNLGSAAGCQGFSVNYPARDHRGHNHGPISHMNQIKDVDLMSSHNPGAVYYGESQYIVPHEFVDGNGNQNNNVVHREYRVEGPDEKGLYFFPHVGESVREEPAVNKWPGATKSLIEPAPLEDGQAFLVYEATDLGGGLWHYEYALYNMNLDRALESLSIPIGSGATLSNVEFYAPLNQPHVTHADNYSNEPWEVAIGGGAITWATDSFADTYLANAVTWGTLYNFRFDANAPPQAVSATVGLFKTGDTVTAATVSPGAVGAVDCNSNGIDDACDLSCDPPGCAVPGCGQSDDCTGNGIPDECEADCQPNGVADSCDLASGTSEDCNRNGIPDECDPGGLLDCNGNQKSDYCDVSSGISEDFNHNGLPDECDPHLGVIHVDDDAPSDPTPGDPADSDPLEDGSPAHPFDSIQEAIDVALIGDVVLVADGVYTGEGNFNISFGGRTITVRSANGPTNCTIDIEFQGSGFVFDHSEKRTARVDGFTIINAANSLDEGARFLVSHAGVKCEGGGPTIANCVIKFSAGRAIHVNRATVRIVNCAIHDNILSLIVIEAGADIQNCTLANELQAALFMFQADVTVTNTIIRVLGDDSILVFDPGSTLDVSYSNVQHGWPGEGNVDVDPLFVDEVGGNLRLTSVSPNIDAGDTTVVGELTDCFGAPRSLDDPDTADTGITIGGAPVVDMGAIEFIPADCNDNGVSDDVDISGGESTDDNGNGVPDECELSFVDCNGNDVPDYSEIDCNDNGIPDECDVDDLTSNDCNGNGIPDECEPGWDQDCNNTGTPDLCDIGDGTSRDCDGNGVPDSCDIETLASKDCNDNGIPDECDLWNRIAEDCDANGRLDSCDLRLRAASDCNANGVIDECETIPDCNANGFLDSCDLDSGSSLDENGNGVPDECDTPDPATAPGPPHDRKKNRYVSFVPAVSELPFALQITLTSSLNHPDAVGQSAWVDEPDPVTGLATLTTAGPVVRVWNEPVVHAGGCLISPVATYEVTATSNNGSTFSTPLVMQTIDQPGGGSWWGDIVGSFNGSEWSEPQGTVNIEDALAVIKKWQQAAGAPHASVTDVEPQILNRLANFNDVLIVIFAFQGDPYPFGCPDDPCQENLVNPCP